MEYKLHISDGEIITNKTKELCFKEALAKGYKLFSTVTQEAVTHQVENEDGTFSIEVLRDANGDPVMHDVTNPPSHTFNWGNIDLIKISTMEFVSRKCIENRRKKFMSDDSQTNALAGIYEQGNNPKKINGQVLSKLKAVEIINAHRDFYYSTKVEIDLCNNVDEVKVILDNLIFP